MASLRKKSGHYYAPFYDKRRSPKRKEIALGCTRKDVARRRLSKMECQFEKGTFDPWNPGDGPDALAFSEATAGFMDSRRHLRTFFNWSVQQGHLEESPLDALDKPKKQKKLPEYLTPEQLERILRAIEADVEMKRPGGQIKQGQVTSLRPVILLAVNTEIKTPTKFHAGALNRPLNAAQSDNFLIGLRQPLNEPKQALERLKDWKLEHPGKRVWILHYYDNNRLEETPQP